MSPEQTRGGALDKRSDIWAFGCLLYEMLTARRPFAGRTTFETVAAILGQDPNWSLLPPTMPARIDWLIRRCLEKDPKRRLHDIADARIEIDDVLAQGSGVGVRLESAAGGGARGRRPWREPVVWAIVAGAVAAAVALTAIASRMLQPKPIETAALRVAIVPPDGVRLGVGNPSGRFAMSPDGRRIAMVAVDRGETPSLWVRPLDTDVAQPLAGTENASFPFWSPDSRSIAFLAQGKLKRIEAAGGPVVTLCDATLSSGGTWNSDNVILFTPRPGSSIHRVAATGGTPVPVTTLNPEKGDAQHFHPSFLPDGRHFLYFVVGSKSGGITDPRAVEIGSLDPQELTKEIVPEGSNAQYANGHLIFLREGTLVAQRFDTERLQLSGQPLPLVEQVQIAGAGSTGVAGAFSVSNTGVLAYQVGLITRSQLAWFDRSGKQLGTLGDQADYGEVNLSPDDSRAAVSILDASAATRDLWVVDVARGLRERLTFDPSDDFAPLWSPDGSRIIYSSRRRQGTIHLYERASSGTGKEQLVFEDGLGKFASDWSADGRFVAFIGGGGIIARSDIWVLSLHGERKAAPFVEGPFPESHAQFSPDARWIAYMSSDSGRPELYVSAYPGSSERHRVSTDGGGWPRWRHDGKELFYLAPDGTLMAVPVDGQSPTFKVGAGRALFKVRLRPVVRLDAAKYDVSIDGQRFLINTFVEEMTSPAIQLVVNWPASLDQ